MEEKLTTEVCTAVENETVVSGNETRDERTDMEVRDGTRSRKIRVIHKLQRPSLRSAIANFVHSFVYEGVPITVLRSSRHEKAAIEMMVALDLFAKCHHYGRVAGDSVCDLCSAKLFGSANSM